MLTLQLIYFWFLIFLVSVSKLIYFGMNAIEYCWRFCFWFLRQYFRKYLSHFSQELFHQPNHFWRPDCSQFRHFLCTKMITRITNHHQIFSNNTFFLKRIELLLMIIFSFYVFFFSSLRWTTHRLLQLPSSR